MTRDREGSSDGLTSVCDREGSSDRQTSVCDRDLID